MKKCSTCGRYLEDDQFYKSGITKTGDQRHSHICKECHKKREMERYYDLADNLLELKVPCICCGESRKYLIEFHHRDPNEKEFVMAHWRKKSKEAILEEIKKCDTLCKNCHAEYHYLNNHFGISYSEYVEMMQID